jgi:hypothetical protein
MLALSPNKAVVYYCMIFEVPQLSTLVHDCIQQLDLNNIFLTKAVPKFKQNRAGSHLLLAELSIQTRYRIARMFSGSMTNNI